VDRGGFLPDRGVLDPARLDRGVHSHLRRIPSTDGPRLILSLIAACQCQQGDRGYQLGAHIPPSETTKRKPAPSSQSAAASHPPGDNYMGTVYFRAGAGAVTHRTTHCGLNLTW